MESLQKELFDYTEELIAIVPIFVRVSYLVLNLILAKISTSSGSIQSISVVYTSMSVFTRIISILPTMLFFFSFSIVLLRVNFIATDFKKKQCIFHHPVLSAKGTGGKQKTCGTDCRASDMAGTV